MRSDICNDGKYLQKTFEGACGMRPLGSLYRSPILDLGLDAPWTHAKTVKDYLMTPYPTRTLASRNLFFLYTESGVGSF